MGQGTNVAECGHPLVKTYSGQVVPACRTLAAGRYFKGFDGYEFEEAFPRNNGSFLSGRKIVCLLVLSIFLLGIISVL